MEEDIRLVGYFKNEDSEREYLSFFCQKGLRGALPRPSFWQDCIWPSSSVWIYGSIYTSAAHTAATVWYQLTRRTRVDLKVVSRRRWAQPHPVWSTVGALSRGQRSAFSTGWCANIPYTNTKKNQTLKSTDVIKDAGRHWLESLLLHVIQSLKKLHSLKY